MKGGDVAELCLAVTAVLEEAAGVACSSCGARINARGGANRCAPGCVWDRLEVALVNVTDPGVRPDALERVRVMCEERLRKALSHGPLKANYDLDTYRAGEIEGWRTCLRVLQNVPPTHTPAQAVYALAGFHMDRSTRPVNRTLYDCERGFLDSREYKGWSLEWNRVISRVQGWLEAEYGPADYENTKDLPTPPLPLLEVTPMYQRDLDASVTAMLGKGAR